MADIVVVTESGIVTVSQGETLVTVYDGRGFKGDPGDSFDQTLNTVDAVEFAGLINNGLTFPTADGTAGQVIETDGAGVLSFVTPSGGDFLPLAGGTMTGNIVFDGTSGQFIGKGTFDTARSGNYGISIVCSVGYEFNWQAGWLVTTEQSSATPRPLYLDSLAGTTLRAWDSSKSTGTEVDHLGITFADSTVQTTAYTGGAGVSSLTAGTGISLDVTTGDITVTNSEPDQTVVLTNGTGITITGTYPSFTIDCDITQYTDTDARLALSAGTGISYDDTTGIITNDEPDQTVVLTDGTGITITGTYPSFTIDCDITQYTDTDARLALSAGTGISYDNATGIITNDDPDQTVTLTNGTDISITGTYPSFTIAYSGTPSSGTVTKASVVSANGFAGTVATDTTTPAITISTSITGLLKGDGTAISAATSGTDYVVPSGSITGNAATVTTNASLTGPITSSGNATSIASQTGTGSKFVVDTSPTLVTPVLGVSTATSVNKITITQPATGSTLTIQEGFTLTANGNATVSGTNTGDDATNSKYSGLVSNATHTGDATGATALTVVAINGVTLSGLATGILKNTTSTGVPSIATAGTDYVVPSGAIGTPSSGTLTSCTGLPISTGVSGLGTNVGTFLATPSSANLAAALTDETGTGANVFATSPTLVTPLLGTPTSGVMTNVTGTASGLTAGNVTTNANLTGHITSTGNAAVLGSFTSAQLLAALTDETGTGANVFATSPTLTTATITSLIETKTAPSISSGTLTLNCSLGNVFQASLNAAITTLTISNIPTTGNAFGITLAFVCDGTARAVTWPAAVKWSGGTAPTLTSTNNKVDIFVLTTWDGGTTWFAMVGGQNF